MIRGEKAWAPPRRRPIPPTTASPLVERRGPPDLLQPLTARPALPGPHHRAGRRRPPDHGDHRRFRDVRLPHRGRRAPDQPEWLSHVNANVLKVELAMAIIGISSIRLLKTRRARRRAGGAPRRATRARRARGAPGADLDRTRALRFSPGNAECPRETRGHSCCLTTQRDPSGI